MNIKLTHNNIERPEVIFNYSYGKYYSKGVLVLASIFIVVGLFLIKSSFETTFMFLIPALIMIFMGLYSFFPIELLQINNIKKEYRVSFKFGSYINGDWKKLGDIKYVSVVNINTYFNVNGDDKKDISKNNIVKEYRLRLFRRAGHFIDVDNYKSKENAIVIGKLIANGLILPLLDATKKPPVFLDL